MENSYVRPDGRFLNACTSLEDQYVADYVRDLVPEADRVEVHNHAVGIGYRTLAASHANSGMLNIADQLSSSVKAAGEHTKSLVASVNEKIDTVVKANFAKGGAVDAAFAEFQKGVAGKLDPDSDVIRKLRERLQQDYGTSSKAVLADVKSLMNLADETSPVARIHRDVLATNIKVAELKTQIEGLASLQTARRATAHASGRQLEAFVNDVVAPLASAQGEMFDDVREEPSKIAGRSKTGDFLTTIDGRLTRGTNAKLVTEAKNRKSGSVSSLITELNHAMVARGAIAAVGVLTNPNAKCRPITAYEGNKVVISLPGFGSPECDYAYFASLIELGYEYGRLLAVARATMQPTEALDAKSIMDGVEELEKAAKGFKALADNHTRIITAVELAKETATGVRDAVNTATKSLRGTLELELDRVRRKALPGTSDAA